MKKRILLISKIVLVLVLALFVLTACNTSKTEVGTNLITNGDFENFTPDAKDSKTGSFDSWNWSKGWDKSTYNSVEVGTLDRDDPEYAEKLGNQYLGITNNSAAYVYLYQGIEVDRKAIYEFKIDIRLKDISKGTNNEYKGAYVNFLENVEVYPFGDVKDVASSDGGKWVTKTFYVKPMDTDYLTVCLAFGAENKTSKGTAYYDNMSMKKVDGVPDGSNIVEFRKAKIARYSSNTDGIVFVTMLSLLSVALFLAAYVMIRRNYASKKAFLNIDENSVYGNGNGKGGSSPSKSSRGSGKNSGSAATQVAKPKDWYKNVWFIAGMLALGTFLIRLIALLVTYGFGYEMDSVVSLARNLAGGVTKAYTNAGLVTTSPGTLYILSIIGAMGGKLSNEGVSILIRMVGVLADIATVAMIYFYGRKFVGNRLSTIYAGLYAALPITFIMSGINGSFVSVLVAMMLGAIILVVEKQYIPMYLVMVLATILDIRALAIAPILLGYMGYMYYKDNDKRYKPTKTRVIIAGGLVGSLILTYILLLPISINQIQGGQAFYGFTVLANMMTQKVIFVQNALNLYAMVGMNMKTSTSTVTILNLLFILVLEMYAVSLYIKNRNKQEIFLIASFAMAVIAVFTLKVDFTYLFLSLALGFIYTMISGDRRMYGIMAMYGVLSFLCVGQLMNNSGFVAAHAKGYFVNFETTSVDFIIFSVLAVLTTLYYAYVTYTITNNGKISDIRPMFEKFPQAFKNGCKNIVSELKSLKKAPKDIKEIK